MNFKCLCTLFEEKKIDSPYHNSFKLGHKRFNDFHDMSIEQFVKVNSI